MIVNMNYVKKQWPDFPTVEMAYFRFINSSSLKTLFTLTILQCVSYATTHVQRNIIILYILRYVIISLYKKLIILLLLLFHLQPVCNFVQFSLYFSFSSGANFFVSFCCPTIGCFDGIWEWTESQSPIVFNRLVSRRNVIYEIYSLTSKFFRKFVIGIFLNLNLIFYLLVRRL